MGELQDVPRPFPYPNLPYFTSEAAVALAKILASPFDCIPKYEELRSFISSVKQGCAPIEDAAGKQTLHIVTFLASVQHRTWNDIKGAFTSYVVWLSSYTFIVDFECRSLLTAAEKLHWPTPVAYSSAASEDRKAFEEAFRNLLKLQTM